MPGVTYLGINRDRPLNILFITQPSSLISISLKSGHSIVCFLHGVIPRDKQL